MMPDAVKADVGWHNIIWLMVQQYGEYIGSETIYLVFRRNSVLKYIGIQNIFEIFLSKLFIL